MKKTVPTILIVLGIILIATPFVGKTILKYKSNAKRDLLNNISSKEIKENENYDAEYDFDSVRDIDLSSMVSGVDNFDERSMVGQIIIPDLDIDLPILKGTNDENLLVGATTMVEGQKMGEGNYPLAGHYMRDKSLLFASLLDIEKGAIVEINNKETVYKYKIYDTVLVKDSDLYMIEDKLAEERGKPVISLMTCYYTSKNGKRFFAVGELIDSYPYDPSYP